MRIKDAEKKLILIFVSAFLLRIINLNQSLWLDEATTARVVQQFNFLEIITKFSPNDFHPPLFYLFMKLWTNMFGYSEISLRMPSVLFSLLTGFFVFRVAKILFGHTVAFWAVCFFLFNPLIVYYSQEARMYLMTTFFLTVGLYYLLRLCHPELVYPEFVEWVSGSEAGFRTKFGTTKDRLFFIISSIVAFATFYGSLFLIIPMVFYLLYKKRQRDLIVFLTLFAVASAVLSPLLVQQLLNAKKQLLLVPNWTMVLGKTNLKNLLLIPLKFSLGRISFYPKWLYWGISAVWTGIIWFFVLKGGLKSKLLLFLLTGSIGLGIIFSFFTPLLQYFRFLYLSPILSILLAVGVSQSHLRGGNWLVLTICLIFSLVYLLNPNFHRENWRSLAEALPVRSTVFMVASSSDPLNYYRKDLSITDFRKIPDKRKRGGVFVIPYTADIHGVDYKTILKNKSYKQVKVITYRDVTLEKWTTD